MDQAGRLRSPLADLYLQNFSAILRLQAVDGSQGGGSPETIGSHVMRWYPVGYAGTAAFKFWWILEGGPRGAPGKSWANRGRGKGATPNALRLVGAREEIGE